MTAAEPDPRYHGSGKTEVYLALIEGMIKRGRQSIVLIPEIALTYQTVQRFTARFGDRVSVMNSTLSVGGKTGSVQAGRARGAGCYHRSKVGAVCAVSKSRDDPDG